MSPQQKEALEEAKQILMLHFDSFVLTTRASNEHGHDSVSSDWHGPLPDVVGMNRMTGLRMDGVIIAGSKIYPQK